MCVHFKIGFTDICIYFLPSQFITDGYDNITRVQVDRYEPCTPVRMPNGAWRLVNEQFYYEQINDISGRDLPLI